MNPTEAQLQVVATGGGSYGAGTTYLGSVSGNTVTFSNVNLSSGVPQSFIISNVRINAAAIGSSGGPVGVNALGYVSVTGANITATATNTPPRLAWSSAVCSSPRSSRSRTSPAQASPVLSQTRLLSATQSMLATAAPQLPAFCQCERELRERFQEQERELISERNTQYASGSESSNLGLEVPGSTIVALGTRVQIVFANIPTGMNIFVPLLVTQRRCCMTLNGSATGPLNAITVPATSPNSVTGLNQFLLHPSSGTATAYYEVTTDNAGWISSAFLSF